MRQNISQLTVVLGAVSMCAAAVFLGTAPLTHAKQNPDSTEIHVLPVQGNIYMLIGGGANITASLGVDGIFLVDAGSAQMADMVLNKLEELRAVVMTPPYPPTTCVGTACRGAPGSGSRNQFGWSSPIRNALIASPAPQKPIRFIVNTSMDSDHTGGNVRLAAAGGTITGGNVARFGAGGEQGAAIWAHESTAIRMQEDPGIPADAVPTDIYYNRIKYKWSEFFNGEGIELHHIPAAHTDGDSIVYFRYSDVISAGDVFSTVSYPVIDTGKGGTLEGVIDGLNKIIDIAFPQAKLQGGTYIIPGHGRLSDAGDVTNYRNMLLKIRDRISDMIDRGLTLDEVKAARPTFDFDGQYGSPDAFVEAAYRSLSAE